MRAHVTRIDGHLRAGQAALDRGAWAEARDCFTAAVRGAETPEALEGLGMAAWGLNDTPLTLDARERAYQLYRHRGDCRGAARVATHLALNHFYFRGEYAIANGWLQRARRLLADLEPCAELGWLAVTEAQIVGWADHDFARVQALSMQAAALGSDQGDIALQILALACEGLALVAQGVIDHGMRCLDEATLAVVAGEVRDVDAACTACCCLIFACEWTRDYERATQWIDRLKTLTSRWSHPTLFYFCRTHYAGLLVVQGAWADAEAELEAAVAELTATQPALAAEALVRLADLRCRQGRFEAAAALLARAEAPPFRALAGDFCLLGRAAMALAHNDLDAASDGVQQFLRAIPQHNRMERVAGLELLVLIQVMRGAPTLAEAVLGELQTVAARVGTKPLHAAARFATGLTVAAHGDHVTAKGCLEDAIDLWIRSGALYEAAQARIALAQSLSALGRNHAATEQAREAVEVLRQFGAVPDAARAAALLDELVAGLQTSSDTPSSGSELTPRELEVLRLVAAGHSNQDIAGVLVLSIRTVERHISNIYAKIGASGPTARVNATAYASRNGLA